MEKCHHHHTYVSFIIRHFSLKRLCLKHLLSVDRVSFIFVNDLRIKEPFPNGESYEQAMLRVHEFYRELKKNHPNKTVLVVGHRATQYGLDTLVGGKTLEDCLSVPFRWQPYWEYNL